MIKSSNPEIRSSASGKERSALGKRIDALLHGRSQAWLAREAEISSGNMSEIMTGQIPRADKAIKLAQALDVTVEFLFTGKNDSGANPLVAADQADWVFVPHYRLDEFTETAKPEPAETVPIRKDWLNQNARVATSLWLTELPSNVEGVGEVGDPILCRDAETHYQEGHYLYFYDGMPIVRKVTGPTLNQLGEPGKQWSYQDEDNHRLRLVARVLGSFKLRAV